MGQSRSYVAAAEVSEGGSVGVLVNLLRHFGVVLIRSIPVGAVLIVCALLGRGGGAQYEGRGRGEGYLR